MSSALVLLLVCLIPLGRDDVIIKPRIIGGLECEYKEYPFAVAVFSHTVCGGSILSPKWILTAAHCIRRNWVLRRETMVRTGFAYGSSLVQVRFAQQGISHSKFNMKRMLDEAQPEIRYDIGLLELDRPFKIGTIPAIAKLPKAGFAETCTVGTAIGIGQTEPDKGSSNHVYYFHRPLMCVDLPIVDEDVCMKTWDKSVFDETVICTMEEEGGKDACNGDSGGALVCEGYVIGVISSGKDCAKPRMAAIFTKVESYLDFIHDTMKYNETSGAIELANTSTCIILYLWVHKIL